MISVLFCGLKNEYGNPEKGLSFEYKHFYDCLQHMPDVAADAFWFDEVIRAKGRDAMNEALIRAVEVQKPDVLFCFLFTEEIKKSTIAYITTHTQTKTFNWFGDDHWRFPIYSRHWAPLFSLVSTTDGLAFERYRKAGITNVIKTQWAANPYFYKPQDQSRNTGKYDITFFGQKYGNRGMYIEALQKRGLPAQGIGRGWEAGGGTDPQQMLDIYSFSKINLNFTETPYYGWKKKLNVLAKLFVKKELGTYSFNGHHVVSNLQAAMGTQRRTIKARTFEVPACGSFLLTGHSADDLNEYLEIGKEVVVFHSLFDLVEKCQYYLTHDHERQAIAEAGMRRVLAEHTYQHRFKAIFERLMSEEYNERN